MIEMKDFLIKRGYSEEQVTKVMNYTYRKNNYGIKTMNDIIRLEKLFSKLLFTEEEIRTLIFHNPNIICRSNLSIVSKIKCLRNIGVPFDKIKYLFINNNNVSFVSVRVINERFKILSDKINGDLLSNIEVLFYDSKRFEKFINSNNNNDDKVLSRR